MTPKEKANKLRYQIENSMQDADMRGHYNQSVKECALIVLRETIWGYLDQFPIDVQNYWEEVKQEIEKL
jgi:hypothetical protein